MFICDSYSVLCFLSGHTVVMYCGFREGVQTPGYVVVKFNLGEVNDSKENTAL